MTTCTIKVQLDVQGKTATLIRIGEIAMALQNAGVEILDVTDDSAPAPVEQPRRTRGPNKPKPQADTSAHNQNGADTDQIDAHEIPGFHDQRNGQQPAHA